MTPSGTIDGLEQSAQLTADRVLNTPPRFKSADQIPRRLSSAIYGPNRGIRECCLV